MALIDVAQGTTGADALASLMEQLFLPLVLPFIGLVIGSSALGEERDDGTILYLASTPLPRLAIALPAIAAAALTTAVLCLPGLLLTILLSAGDDLGAANAAWAIASVLVGAVTYAAVFGALSLRVKRPVVIGLIYVLFWEGSIATFAPSARWLSLGAYAPRDRRRRAAVVDRRERAGDRRARGRRSCSPRRRRGVALVRPAPRAASSCPSPRARRGVATRRVSSSGRATAESSTGAITTRSAERSSSAGM